MSLIRTLLIAVVAHTVCVSSGRAQTTVISPGAYAESYYPHFDDRGAKATALIDPADFGHSPVGQLLFWDVKRRSPENQKPYGQSLSYGETENLIVDIYNLMVGQYVFMISDPEVGDNCDYYFPFDVQEIPFPHTSFELVPPADGCGVEAISAEIVGGKKGLVVFNKVNTGGYITNQHSYCSVRTAE